FSQTWTADAGDIGLWQISAHPAADPTCTDTVALSVVAAPKATPSPTPSPSAGALPNTAYRERSGDDSPERLWLATMLFAGLGSAGWMVGAYAARTARRRVNR